MPKSLNVQAVFHAVSPLAMMSLMASKSLSHLRGAGELRVYCSGHGIAVIVSWEFHPCFRTLLAVTSLTSLLETFLMRVPESIRRSSKDARSRFSPAIGSDTSCQMPLSSTELLKKTRGRRKNCGHGKKEKKKKTRVKKPVKNSAAWSVDLRQKC